MASLVLVLALGIVGCNKDNNNNNNEPAPTPPPAGENNNNNNDVVEEGKYENGIYYAENENFAGSGWMANVTIEVDGGNITKAEWNGANIEGGKDKINFSADGEYNMVQFGGAIAEWHEQAKLVEEYLIETQDPTKVEYTTEEGNTDDIAGVTMKVQEYFTLVEKALAAGPIAKGDYKDGFYYAAADDFHNGFKTIAHVAVVNGKIVGASYNGIGEGEDAPNKYAASESGEYDMKTGGATADWHEQAALVAKHLIETQDPTGVEYTNDDGNTDDIAGVTMKVKGFFDLAEKALADAK